MEQRHEERRKQNVSLKSAGVKGDLRKILDQQSQQPRNGFDSKALWPFVTIQDELHVQEKIADLALKSAQTALNPKF